MATAVNRWNWNLNLNLNCLVAGLALAAVGCTDDGGGNADEIGADEGVSTTLGGTETSGSEATDSLDEGDTGSVCEDEQVECGSDCCALGEVCFEGACAADCGGEPACGSESLCCGDAEVCYLGACVEPAGPCSQAACATQENPSECDEGYVCDPDLEMCVPSEADSTCTYKPPDGDFSPHPEFTWGMRKQVACDDEAQCQTGEDCIDDVCTVSWTHVSPADAVDNVHVSSIPVVADLDRDCVPEIIFNTYKAGVYKDEGVLRAINGATGEQLWSVTDPDYESDATANPAVGDLDGDGFPEVVVAGPDNRLIAIDSDGTPLWISDSYSGNDNSGSVSIANMDGQGPPEIVFGAAVFSNEGVLLWEGNMGIGHESQGPISCVADLDNDFRPEIIGGNTAYKTTGTVAGGDFSGSVYWEAPVGDGRCGVADFDEDGNAEVILVRGGNIYALDGQEGALIDTFPIPGSSDRGGAPNIADFDADGVPDVATAGATFYVVASFDGVSFEEQWRAATEDGSSRVTGSSVFDFDGDGKNEVIYNDEKFIRIYPGVEPDCELVPVGPKCDGIMDDDEVLFRDPNTSRTRTEYPVVADVDGDFKAELVFSNNADVDWGLDAGIEVWGDLLDNWVSTRPVWNQHSYHITNVGIDGSIPVVEQSSWLVPEGEPYNGYRRNVQGASDFCAPDLVPFDLRAEWEACPSLILTVDVANLGCLGVGPGVQVSFYEQEVGYLGTISTQGALPAGAKETLTLDTGVSMSSANVWVVVDDDGEGKGALNECHEDNQSEVVEVCKPIG